MSVREATERELEALGALGSARGVAALVLADKLDNERTSATAASMCAARLDELLDRILELNPPAPKQSDLGDLNARRAERRRRAGTPA